MTQTSKNNTGEPREPPEEIKEKQDPTYSREDFLRDLQKVSKKEGSTTPPPDQPD